MLHSRPMNVLFRYDIQTFYTAIIIIIVTITLRNSPDGILGSFTMF